jgi:hypothetical protein
MVHWFLSMVLFCHAERTHPGARHIQRHNMPNRTNCVPLQMVTYAGLPIWTQNDDLCAKTACPVAKGPTEVVYQQPFPYITPPVGAGCGSLPFRTWGCALLRWQPFGAPVRHQCSLVL